MRIFTAIRHSNDPAFYYGGLWSSNFYPALKQFDCEIIESQVDLLPASRFMHVPDRFTAEEKKVRAEITQQVVDEVKQAHSRQPIDLFLSYFYNAHFDPDGFADIHRLGIPTVNFYCNSIYQFELVSAIAAKAMWSWHPEREARSRYLQVGANPVWVQMGADPQVYYPILSLARQAKACFIGQRYADRDRQLAALIHHQVPVHIYGGGWNQSLARSVSSIESLQPEYLGRRQLQPGSLRSYAHVAWKRWKTYGALNGLQKILLQMHYRQQSRQLAQIVANAACGYADNISEVFAQYEVVLNFSNVWADGHPGSALIPHVRLRDFEAPMSRTCYLTGYTDEIAEFYHLGQEIDTYQDTNELVDKTRFYLRSPSAAEKLREAGYQRAIACHTWRHRFEQLFQCLTLKVPTV
jgi:spore maturation protein CgeB